MTDAAARLEKGHSLWADAFGRLRKNRMAVAGMGVVIFMSLVALVAPWIVPYDPASNELDHQHASPGYQHTLESGEVHRHWLGTDDQGRDVVARMIYGFRISVLFGFVLTIISAAVGVSVGAFQGF